MVNTINNNDIRSMNIVRAGMLGWMPWTYRTYPNLVSSPPFILPHSFVANSLLNKCPCWNLSTLIFCSNLYHFNHLKKLWLDNKKANTNTNIQGFTNLSRQGHTMHTWKWNQTTKLHKHKMDSWEHIYQRHKNCNNESDHYYPGPGACEK